MSHYLIRAAQPNSADAHAFAQLAEIAAYGEFARALGGTAADTLAEMFQQKHNDHSYLHTQFALLDHPSRREVVGMVNGFSDTQRLANRKRTRQLLNQNGGLRRRDPIDAFINRVTPGAYHVHLLAVRQPYRRDGVARMLLQQSEEIAYILGCTILELDVDIDNETAIAAYENYGFYVSAASPTIRYGDQTLGVYRMTRPVTITEMARV